MDFSKIKSEIETGKMIKIPSIGTEDHSQTTGNGGDYPPSLQPIFDAHDLVADLYGQIQAENKWKRLSLRKALLDPRVRKAEDAVSAQCRIALDESAGEEARRIAGERIEDAMAYWQQLVIGKN